MKALTVRQPHATLIAIGAKQIETRGQKTAHRGEIAIHAGRSTEMIEALKGGHGLRHGERFRSVLTAAGYTSGQDLPLGAIVAVVDLWDCRQLLLVDSKPFYLASGADQTRIWVPVSEQEAAFGDFSYGRHGLMLRTVRRLDQPVPCRGMPGMFDLPADVERAVRAQLSKAPPVRDYADVIESHAARQVEEL